MLDKRQHRQSTPYTTMKLQTWTYLCS